jgi:hypothetical protein
MSENATRFKNPPRRCERCGRSAAISDPATGHRRWKPGTTLCERHARAVSNAVRPVEPRSASVDGPYLVAA